jgi:hypothetical protein
MRDERSGSAMFLRLTQFSLAMTERPAFDIREVTGDPSSTC